VTTLRTGIFGLCGEVGLFQRLKCISTIGESAFGGQISGPCREVISIMVPSRRVHYRRFHCILCPHPAPPYEVGIYLLATHSPSGSDAKVFT
jgi:hypothetical protein